MGGAAQATTATLMGRKTQAMRVAIGGVMEARAPATMDGRVQTTTMPATTGGRMGGTTCGTSEPHPDVCRPSQRSRLRLFASTDTPRLATDRLDTLKSSSTRSQLLTAPRPLHMATQLAIHVLGLAKRPLPILTLSHRRDRPVGPVQSPITTVRLIPGTLVRTAPRRMNTQRPGSRQRQRRPRLSPSVPVRAQGRGSGRESWRLNV